MTSARVHSVEALQRFKDAVCRFGDDAGKAICSLDMEVRRSTEWIEDQAKHWQRQIRDCQDSIAQARNELARQKIRKSFDGRPPDTTEQEKALYLARRRLAEAEEKLEQCRRWLIKLPHEIGEYQGPVRRLSSFVDADVPRMVASLEHKIKALSAYLDVRPPASESPS